MDDTEMSDIQDRSAAHQSTLIHQAGLDSSRTSLTPAKTGHTVNPSKLQKIPEDRLHTVEKPREAYGDIFDQLQLRQETWDRFFLHVARLVRQKHLGQLRRLSETDGRALSGFLLRGYGYKIWAPQYEHEWLRPLKDGEERLWHIRKSEHKNDNDRFYPVLQKLWQRMHDTIFEARSSPLKRGRKRAREQVLSNGCLRYEADAAAPRLLEPVTSRKPQARPYTNMMSPETSIRQHIFNMKLQLQTKSATRGASQYLTVDETRGAVNELVQLLSLMRTRCDPTHFETVWNAQIGRLQDIEYEAQDRHCLKDSVFPPDSTSAPGPPQGQEKQCQQPLPVVKQHTQIQNWQPQPLIPPPNSHHHIRKSPTHVTLHISTSLSSPTAANPYIWPDAPCSSSARGAFFAGIDARVSLPLTRVRGWCLSYGWSDQCRWIENSLSRADAEVSWGEFQQDLRTAAHAWIGTDHVKQEHDGIGDEHTADGQGESGGPRLGGWRMKVLVVARR